MLVHPDLLNAWGYGAAEKTGDIPVWNLFGLEVQKVGYQGQVLPILVASYLLAKLELFITKRTPESIQLLVVAPITLLVIGFLSFIVIGPVTFAIGNVLTSGLVAVFQQFAALGGLLYGGLYAALVITGMHHTFLAVDIQLINSKLHGTFLWPMLALSNIAQGSAALAMMFVLKMKNKRTFADIKYFCLFRNYRTGDVWGQPALSIPIYFCTDQLRISRYVYRFSRGAGKLSWCWRHSRNFLHYPEILGAFAIGMVIVLILPFIGTLLYAKLKRRRIFQKNLTSGGEGN